MADNRLMGKIEAVLFASGDPVEVAKLSQILKADKGEIDNALAGLKSKYEKKNSGIKMLELDKSVQLSNKEEYGDYIKEALLVKRNAPLSSAAMEVLSIVAYNQPEPVTKSFIEQIRGVDSSATVNSLVEKGLIEEAGRHNLPGRPIVYRTTDVFLRSFGISSIAELPPLPSEEEKQLDLGLTEMTDNATSTTEVGETITNEVETSTEVEETAVNEVETAFEVEETVANEVETAFEVGETITNEVETPTEVEEIPVNEVETAFEVEETAVNEVETPTEVEETAVNEVETAFEVEETAVNEVETSIEVEEIPVNEVETASEVEETVT